MAIMLGMLLAFYGVVIAILYITKQKTAPTFDEYSVGGRSYGTWFVAMSYINSWWPGSTFIAFFGLAAGAGVFGLYALAYSTLGVAFMYLMATRAWRWGKAYDLRTQPDLLRIRFGSNAVRVVASIIGVVSLFPWVVLGMQALGTLFEIASAGTWSVIASLVVGLVVILIRQIWTVQMGMRGLIMTDMFQGFVAYIVSGIVCAIMLTGAFNSPISWSDLGRVGEKFLTLPGDGDTYGPFYISALIFTGVIGSLCWPTSFQRIYTASSVRTVKKGTLATILVSATFYTVLMLVGIAAVNIPEVAAAPQEAWFTLMEQFGGTWLLGLAVVVVFAAQMGHTDASVQVAGLQVANDIVATIRKRPLSDKQLTLISKVSMVVYMLLAGVLAFATFDFDRLQLLAQISYQGIIQLAVPLFFGIFWRGGNRHGALWGMVSGFVIAAVLTGVYPDDIPALGSLTSGIVGLIVNAVVFLVVSAITGRTDEERLRVEAMFRVAESGERALVAPDDVQPVSAAPADALVERTKDAE
ncbi:Na+/proline symporter [Microbacterium sp. SORGH_AS 1204]|uniref:sodium:solute symporter family protein n=1 Tax=Microbacterium sp. SORGH_AS_1204 TaxID=3041785 RepID=UPI00278F0585|nr:sodium:solute symporter family protein [Microbacterium sp. SORGH_AS_1204]MDQ1135321.1 Na+/proline symporter [Microbacterium sp. SORGH_AS_1204]